jgi:hypothetical protein
MRPLGLTCGMGDERHDRYAVMHPTFTCPFFVTHPCGDRKGTMKTKFVALAGDALLRRFGRRKVLVTGTLWS